MIARHITRHGSRSLALAVVVLCAACSRNRPETEESLAEPVQIVFDNQSLDQADLFAVMSGGGEARRLGTVMSGRTETLRMGADLAVRGGVSLVARRLNGGSLSTGIVAVHPGDTLHIQLPLNPRLLLVLP